MLGDYTYQSHEKLTVATYYCIDFQKLAHMEFDRWRKLANRYSKELSKMFDACIREGSPEELAMPLNKTKFYRQHAQLLRGGK